MSGPLPHHSSDVGVSDRSLEFTYVSRNSFLCWLGVGLVVLIEYPGIVVGA